MGASCPIETFNQTSLDSYESWTSLFKYVHMHDTASAVSAEEASLFSSAVARAIEVRDCFVARKREERKYSRCAEGARGLFAAVETMTVVEL